MQLFYLAKRFTCNIDSYKQLNVSNVIVLFKRKPQTVVTGVTRCMSAKMTL